MAMERGNVGVAPDSTADSKTLLKVLLRNTVPFYTLLSCYKFLQGRFSLHLYLTPFKWGLMLPSPYSARSKGKIHAHVTNP